MPRQADASTATPSSLPPLPPQQQHHHAAATLSSYIQCLADNPHYRNLFFADLIDNTGAWLNYVATLELVSSFSSGSGLALSAVVLIRFLPSLVLGPLAGVLADRCNRLTILIVAALVDSLFAAGLALVHRPSQVPLLFVLLCLQFAAIALQDPSRRSIVPVLVNPAQLHLATTLETFSWSLTGAFGAALGGAVASKLGNAVCFLFDAATYLLAAWFASKIPRVLGDPMAMEKVHAKPPSARHDHGQPHPRGGDVELAASRSTMLMIHAGESALRNARRRSHSRSPSPVRRHRNRLAPLHRETADVPMPMPTAMAMAMAMAMAESRGGGGGAAARGPYAHVSTSARTTTSSPTRIQLNEHQDADEHEEEGCDGRGQKGVGELSPLLSSKYEIEQGMPPTHAVVTTATHTTNDDDRYAYAYAYAYGDDGDNNDDDDDDDDGRYVHNLDFGADTESASRSARNNTKRSGTNSSKRPTPTGCGALLVFSAAWSGCKEGFVAALEGLQYIRNNRDVAVIVFAKGCGSLTWGAVDVLNVKFSEDPGIQLGGDGAATLGLIFAVVGLGCFLGPVALNPLVPPHPAQLLRATAGAFVLLFAGAALMAAARSLPIVLAATFVRAVGSATMWIYSTLLLQLRCPNSILGRVSAAEAAWYNVAEAASAAFGGAALDWMGLDENQTALLLAVAGGGIASGWVWYAWREAKGKATG